jgi:hypothetical protein
MSLPQKTDLAGAPKPAWKNLLPSFVVEAFLRFDRRMDGAASFFVKHYGKTRFMVAMSKKAQYLGLERLFLKGPKAFLYFFMFYLIRDTILYIIIPIWFATMVD